MHRLLRRRSALALASTGLALPALAQQGFPNRPVRLIVPWPAGGSADAHFRVLAELAGKQLGQPVIVENRPGASGTLGAVAMANEPRGDGYLVGQFPVTAFRLPVMQRRPAFDPMKDFTWILHLTGYLFGVVVRADSPWQNWAQFLDHAKANPGKVSYGTPGVGSSLHITMERIAELKGIQWLHAPFRGGSDTSQALLAGTIDAQADSTGWAPLVEDGKFRLLVTWGAERAKRFPNTPTLRETGIDIVSASPYGLAAPKGLDPGITRALHDAFKLALHDPVHRATLDRYDMPLIYLNSADYAAYAAQLYEEEAAIIRKLGLRAD